MKPRNVRSVLAFWNQLRIDVAQLRAQLSWLVTMLRTFGRVLRVRITLSLGFQPHLRRGTLVEIQAWTPDFRGEKNVWCTFVSSLVSSDHCKPDCIIVPDNFSAVGMLTGEMICWRFDTEHQNFELCVPGDEDKASLTNVPIYYCRVLLAECPELPVDCYIEVSNLKVVS